MWFDKGLSLGNLYDKGNSRYTMTVVVDMSIDWKNKAIIKIYSRGGRNKGLVDRFYTGRDRGLKELIPLPFETRSGTS